MCAVFGLLSVEQRKIVAVINNGVRRRESQPCACSGRIAQEDPDVPVLKIVDGFSTIFRAGWPVIRREPLSCLCQPFCDFPDLLIEVCEHNYLAVGAFDDVHQTF